MKRVPLIIFGVALALALVSGVSLDRDERNLDESVTSVASEPSTTSPAATPSSSSSPETRPKAVYFVKNGGDDSASGTSDEEAWATVHRVVTDTFPPGTTIRFRRGDVWRESIDLHGPDGDHFSSGAPVAPITITAYGIGPKPLFLGSDSLGDAAEWSQFATNIWRRSTATEVCAMHYDTGTLHGIRRNDIDALSSQGDYCWRSPYVYVYSVENPGRRYADIEGSRFENGVDIGQKHDIVLQNLDLRYWGSGGIRSWQSGGILVDRCDVSWTGDGVAGMPWGNALNVGHGSHDWEVRFCNFYHAYDAGLSPIVSDTGATTGDLVFHHNTVAYCEYGFELQTSRTADGPADSIHVRENVFFKNGGGPAHAVRPDPYGTALKSWFPHGTSRDCTFSDNIVYESTETHVQVPTSGWSLRRNRYFPDGYAKFTVYGGSAVAFAPWQASGQDTGSSLLGAVSGEDAQIIATLRASL